LRITKTILVETETIFFATILVKGADKQLVGAVAAEIRATRPMEPYHGYGIHYTSEKVILKPGKSGKKK
jgi:large subunit ribosomal protein L6